MTLFDRFRHSVDKTKFKAERLVRINRIQGEIGDLKRDISTLNLKISNKAYELFQKGMLTNPELIELCSTVDQLNKQIIEKQAKIDEINREEYQDFIPTDYRYTPLNPCPDCKFDVPVGAEYCPNCGSVMYPYPATHTPEPTATTIPCTHSNAPADARYCPDCGQPLNRNS